MLLRKRLPATAAAARKGPRMGIALGQRRYIIVSCSTARRYHLLSVVFFFFFFFFLGGGGKEIFLVYEPEP